MNPQPQNRNEPISLHDHAQENLRFIRAAMESTTSFTGVSGLGYGFAGLTAIPAAWLAQSQSETNGWLTIWMIELILGASIAFGFTIRKASGQGDSMLSASGRKLLLAFLPAMFAGGLITLSFFLSGFVQLLPGVWLSLYGAAVMTAGAWSVRAIPIMGALFIFTGAVAMLAPVSGDVMLALGFGCIHIVFGIVIWRKYGG